MGLFSILTPCAAKNARGFVIPSACKRPFHNSKSLLLENVFQCLIYLSELSRVQMERLNSCQVVNLRQQIILVQRKSSSLISAFLNFSQQLGFETLRRILCETALNVYALIMKEILSRQPEQLS